MIKIIRILLLFILINTEIIALYDFSNIELNGEIKDIQGISNSFLQTNDLLSNSKGEISLRLNFDKKEYVINKSKYNFIKNELIERGELFLKIDFDIRYAKEERICLFCLRSEEKTPNNECEKYDFAIIKNEDKILLIFKDPKTRGCYYSERVILWKEEYERQQTQSILFIYDKNGKHLFINDEKVLDFYNNDNEGYVVNNWNENLEINMGLEDLKDNKKTNGFLDLFKLQIYDSKKKIQKKKKIQNWIKTEIDKLDDCNCGNRIEKSKCFCQSNIILNYYQGNVTV